MYCVWSGDANYFGLLLSERLSQSTYLMEVYSALETKLRL